MLNYAVANPQNEDQNQNDQTEQNEQIPTKAFDNFRKALKSARSAMTMTVLNHTLRDTMVESPRSEIGGILQYDGPTVMVEPQSEKLGLEINDDDLLFTSSDGVWIGTVHYDDMPAEIENYRFIASGNLDDYHRFVQEKLEADLQAQSLKVEEGELVMA